MQQREQVIAMACTDLANDLRQIDPLTYVLFFNTTNMPEVFDRISGIFEKHFPSNKMFFACTGECYGGWAQKPMVAFDIEFDVPELFVFFRLFIAEKEIAVELHHITFHDTGCGSTANTNQLIGSFTEAKLSRNRAD